MPKKSREDDTVFEQVYKIVLKIPQGKVMTYGQISRVLNERLSAAGVGWALHATPQDERRIPWHRVVNSRGGISTTKIIAQHPNLQQAMLEEEGVVFNDKGFIDLSIYQWSMKEE